MVLWFGFGWILTFVGLVCYSYVALIVAVIGFTAGVRLGFVYAC